MTTTTMTTEPTAEERAAFCRDLREMMDNWDLIRNEARKITDDEEEVYQMTSAAFCKSLGLDKFLANLGK